MPIPNYEDFKTHFRIDAAREQATNLDRKTLDEIYDHYLLRRRRLETVASKFARRLVKEPGVQAIRWRVKEPKHLIEKIFRDRAESPNPNVVYAGIGYGNYDRYIKDLIGIRALHVFKMDWVLVHRAILSKFTLVSNDPLVAHVGEHESAQLIGTYEKAGFRIKARKDRYRSLHYVVEERIDSQDYFAEIQVRTLFEEGCGEVDHRLRYPYNREDDLLAAQLGSLYAQGSVADEMATMAQGLACRTEPGSIERFRDYLTLAQVPRLGTPGPIGSAVTIVTGPDYQAAEQFLHDWVDETLSAGGESSDSAEVNVSRTARVVTVTVGNEPACRLIEERLPEIGTTLLQHLAYHPAIQVMVKTAPTSDDESIDEYCGPTCQDSFGLPFKKLCASFLASP